MNGILNFEMPAELPAPKPGNLEAMLPVYNLPFGAFDRLSVIAVALIEISRRIS